LASAIAVLSRPRLPGEVSHNKALFPYRRCYTIQPKSIRSSKTRGLVILRERTPCSVAVIFVGNWAPPLCINPHSCLVGVFLVDEAVRYAPVSSDLKGVYAVTAFCVGCEMPGAVIACMMCCSLLRSGEPSEIICIRQHPPVELISFFVGQLVPIHHIGIFGIHNARYYVGCNKVDQPCDL
jgi:hypothetical protein